MSTGPAPPFPLKAILFAFTAKLSIAAAKLRLREGISSDQVCERISVLEARIRQRFMADAKLRATTATRMYGTELRREHATRNWCTDWQVLCDLKELTLG